MTKYILSNSQICKFSIFIFLASAVFIGFFGCKNSTKTENYFTIKGELNNAKNGQTIFLDLLTDSSKTIDSATINNGTFLFKRKSNEICFYLLRYDKKNAISLLVDTTENIVVNADAKKMRETYTVSGSKGSELVRDLEIKRLQSVKKLDSLKHIFNEKEHEKNFAKIKLSLDSTWYVIFNNHQSFIKEFINKNINSLASLIAISEELGRTRFLKPKEDYDYFIRLDSALIKQYPRNENVKAYHDKMAEIKRMKLEDVQKKEKLAIGSMAPEIKLPDMKGKTVALSSLKGKFVLITFWGSWLHPCVDEIPKLNEIYNKYKSKGFEIYGVSIDQKKVYFEEALKTLKIKWINVSDFIGWNSSIVQLYDVKVVPTTYLLDMEGKIIAKGLIGESLENKLKEVIK